MRLRLLSVLVLIATSPAWADTGTSTSTLTIDPSATAGTTINAADENDRSNDASTWANAHVHRLSNTTNFGDAAAGNKSLCADAADTTDSCLRWNDTANLWQIDHPVAGTFNQITTSSGTGGLTAAQVVLGDGTGALRTTSGGSSGQVLTHQGAGVTPIWSGVPVPTDAVTFTRTGAAGAGTQSVTGMAFQPSTLLFFCEDDAADEGASWGFSDDDSNEMELDHNSATNYAASTTSAINIQDVSAGGANNMSAVVTSYDTDGFTLTWSENGTGPDVECVALGWD